MNRDKIPITAFLVLGLACSCVLGSLGCAKKEIINLNSKGKNIICFGDSVSFGYGVNQGEDYPSALAKLVGYPVINAGVDIVGGADGKTAAVQCGDIRTVGILIKGTKKLNVISGH